MFPIVEKQTLFHWPNFVNCFKLINLHRELITGMYHLCYSDSRSYSMANGAVLPILTQQSAVAFA